MRIIKKTQSLLKGLIYNTKTDSNVDTYSCDYINNLTSESLSDSVPTGTIIDYNGTNVPSGWKKVEIETDEELQDRINKLEEKLNSLPYTFESINDKDHTEYYWSDLGISNLGSNYAKVSVNLLISGTSIETVGKSCLLSVGIVTRDAGSIRSQVAKVTNLSGTFDNEVLSIKYDNTNYLCHIYLKNRINESTSMAWKVTVLSCSGWDISKEDVSATLESVPTAGYTEIKIS